jgi:hypothetical protein
MTRPSWLLATALSAARFRPPPVNGTRFGATLEGFDLMPDGKRIVIIPAADQKEPTHATFLLNFIDDLPGACPQQSDRAIPEACCGIAT